MRPHKLVPGARDRSHGQILVLFASSLIVLLGAMAIVIDLSWFWANSLRVQRAADAAALAGVVNLPGDPAGAFADAWAEATKNGYTNGAGGVVVTPAVDGSDPRRMIVRIEAPVGTFFMNVFGMGSIGADRTAKAEFIQPVPMGSPLNYYGVYQDCRIIGAVKACADLPDASGIGLLSSQGFFGAIEGQGSNRSTGDAYATNYNPRGTVSSLYDPDGYDYLVEVNQAGGSVAIYDPTFCATTSGPGGGHLGTGDHWINSGGVNALPASIYFRLWDTQGTLRDGTDDVRADPTGDDALFASDYQVDRSPTYAVASPAGGSDNNYADGNEPGTNGTAAPADCAAGQINNQAIGGYWHNRWWTIASGLATGTYRLQVTTTDPAQPTANVDQMFENMWSLEVSGGGNPKVHGSGRMVSYANIQSGQQEFFLAQVDRASGAGKTLQIDLFDPGDVGNKAWVQVLSPDGNVYTPASMTWTADGNATAGHQGPTTATCIQTYGSGTAINPPAGGNPGCSDNFTAGGQYFQNSWIKIQIPLGGNYGLNGLTPTDPQNPRGEAGWWKIRYTVNNASDTTTWQVSLLGNPVHLVR